MRRVASRFAGREGVVVQLGDSLTIAQPNSGWVRHGDHTRAVRRFLDWAHAGAKDDSDGWYLATAPDGPAEELRSFTASIGCSAKYSLAGGRLPPLADLLARYEPQLVVFGIGASDAIRETPLSDYVRDAGAALDLIVARGAVPIVLTVSPLRANNDTVLRLNSMLRGLARERKLPLLDVYAELAARNPNVFDFLADDGVHLTAGPYKGPPTEENFLSSGYLLRCYLTVRKAMQVKRRVLDA